MIKKSAGILFYRFRAGDLQFLLVHPGGPFWAKKDEGAWSIPKGEIGEDEDAFRAAVREVREELGIDTVEKAIALSVIRQKGGKLVYAWAVEQDIDAATITSNSFEMEWPPRSGKKRSFPEIDKADWFHRGDAEKKILAAQSPLLDELTSILAK